MKAAEAAKKADVSPSTITRWVQAGTLSSRRLASGELEIEESELDEFLAGRTSAPRQGGTSNSAVALAVAEERIRGLDPHFPYQPCRACRNQQRNYPM